MTSWPIHRPALVNQICAFQVLDIVLHRWAGNPVQLLGNRFNGYDLRQHVAAFYYQQAASVGYYRGGKKDKEIDIVVEYPNSRPTFRTSHFVRSFLVLKSDP